MEAIELKNKFKTRKEKRVLVVNGTFVSQYGNKRKIEEVQGAINEVIATASVTASSASTTIPSSSIPSSYHSIFWQSTDAQAIFQTKKEKLC
jgi:hypothetical protein